MFHKSQATYMNHPLLEHKLINISCKGFNILFGDMNQPTPVDITNLFLGQLTREAWILIYP